MKTKLIGKFEDCDGVPSIRAVESYWFGLKREFVIFKACKENKHGCILWEKVKSPNNCPMSPAYCWELTNFYKNT